MIEERAVILTLEEPIFATSPQTENHSVATLEIVRKTACGLCGQTRGCGNSIWGKLFAHKSTSFKAQNSINAKVGDSVIVAIDDAALVKSALLLYIVPLVTMMFAAILAGQASGSDLMVVLGAVIGLVLGFVWVKGHTEGSAYYQRHQPRILRLDDSQLDDKVIQFQ